MTPGPSRPPFTPETAREASMTHGASSRSLIEPRARELAPAIFEANPHLDEARDGPAVMRYGILLARIKRVYGWLSKQADPVFRDAQTGEVHRVFERLERWERQAAEAEDKLAIAPLTRARLGLDQLKAQATLRDFMDAAPTAEATDAEEGGE